MWEGRGSTSRNPAAHIIMRVNKRDDSALTCDALKVIFPQRNANGRGESGKGFTFLPDEMLNDG